MDGLLLCLLLGAGVWFWLDSLRSREIALEVARAGCRQRAVQLLDETVAVHRLQLRRTCRGLRFRRVYRFDFSDRGDDRLTGYLIMLGMDLEEFSLGLPNSERDA